jgi:hypothetical protein
MTLTSGILLAILTNGTIDSFAQSALSNSTQDQESNVTSVTATSPTASQVEPLFVEQGKVTGQRVLAVIPQPQIETSFMANTSIHNGTTSIVNAINIGTTTITLNSDGTFSGEGHGVLRSESAGFASWTSHTIGNLTPEGEILVRGVTFWHTPQSASAPSSSTTGGELEFMDGVIGLFKMEINRHGSLSVSEWKWDS